MWNEKIVRKPSSFLDKFINKHKNDGMIVPIIFATVSTPQSSLHTPTQSMSGVK